MANPKQFDPADQIGRQLDQTDDPTLLILRAHLLIEERLRDVLGRVCRSPDELDPARLSFYQILCLCRAIVGRHDEPAWAFIERLNEVRNRMSHRLDPGDLDDLVGSVAAKLRIKYAGAQTPVDRFRLAAYFVCGYVEAISGGVRLGLAYAD